jgi:hypothetical protein
MRYGDVQITSAAANVGAVKCAECVRPTGPSGTAAGSK